MRSKIFRIIVSLFLAAGVMRAQETRASLSGTILDPSGSVVAGASLRLTNLETGVVFATTSNQAGQYRFLFLNPGKYKVIAEMSGFKTFERDNIELSVNQAGTLPVMLEVGSQAETITVQAEAPLMEAEKADRGLVVDNKKVVDIPINTRNPIMLAALSNGITHTSGSTLDLKPFSNSADGSWSVNGGKASTAEFLLDGAPNNAVYNGVTTVAIVPSVDAVQEFKVMTSTYDAQYGHSGGGAINFSLKSGANGLHGSGYEFLKRTGLNANTFANNAHRSPLADNSLDQYGFTIGGPVTFPKVYKGKDRTLFFFAFEKYRENQEYPSERISSVPTLAQRKGDFSDTRDNAGNLIAIYDPVTGRFDANNRWVRDRFAGNTVPAERINAVATKLLSYYSAPEHGHGRIDRLAEQLLSGRQRRPFHFQERDGAAGPQLRSEGARVCALVVEQFRSGTESKRDTGTGRELAQRRQIRQRRGDRFRYHAQPDHHPEHARVALLLAGADRPARLRFQRHATGLAGFAGEPVAEQQALSQYRRFGLHRVRPIVRQPDLRADDGFELTAQPGAGARQPYAQDRPRFPHYPVHAIPSQPGRRRVEFRSRLHARGLPDPGWCEREQHRVDAAGLCRLRRYR
jgi:hypothetical protein